MDSSKGGGNKSQSRNGPPSGGGNNNRGKMNNTPSSGNSGSGIKRRSDNGPRFNDRNMLDRGLMNRGGPMPPPMLMPQMGPPGGFGSPMMPNPMAGGPMDPAWMEPRPPPMGIMGAPTYEIPIREKSEEERKFTGRCRIFVANLPPKVTEASLKELFEQFGEVSEVFLGKSNAFAFVKMDTRKHAEDARDALDNKNYEGRTLRVRLAAHAAAVKVKNLSPMVTNELLEYAFCYFGEVERAIVITDERGRSTGEGIVEFARKQAAQICLKRCTTECFLLTANPSPVIVEPFEQKDEDEGFTERHVQRHTHEFRMEREVGPRFAEPGTFEYEFGQRWKQLYELEKEKRERLELEVREARQALIEQMDFARMEHQTKLLKEKLRMMEEQSGKYTELRNNRAEIEKRREEERAREEALFRQREEEILRRSMAAEYGSMHNQDAVALQDLIERVRFSDRSY